MSSLVPSPKLTLVSVSLWLFCFPLERAEIRSASHTGGAQEKGSSEHVAMTSYGQGFMLSTHTPPSPAPPLSP